MTEVPAEVFEIAVAIVASRAQERAIKAEREALAADYIAEMEGLAQAGRHADLLMAMDGLKAAYGPGWAPLVEAAGLPRRTALQRAILGRCNDGEGRWAGAYPLTQDSPRPLRGMWVVYQLIDDQGAMVYIGSSGSFPERLKAHGRTKNFARWRASSCPSERACRELEAALIDRYRPPLNRMIPTPRLALL